MNQSWKTNRPQQQQPWRTPQKQTPKKHGAIAPAIGVVIGAIGATVIVLTTDRATTVILTVACCSTIFIIVLSGLVFLAWKYRESLMGLYEEYKGK